jgi:hypothetical protein
MLSIINTKPNKPDFINNDNTFQATAKSSH